MTTLVDPSSSIAATSFDLRCATPPLPMNQPTRLVAASIARRTSHQPASATDRQRPNPHSV
jgi:hypothetical protein